MTRKAANNTLPSGGDGHGVDLITGVDLFNQAQRAVVHPYVMRQKGWVGPQALAASKPVQAKPPFCRYQMYDRGKLWSALSQDRVDTSGLITDGKEWGRESELAYVVQSGALKNLSFRWRNSSVRRDFSTNEFDENRISINYPISLL